MQALYKSVLDSVKTFGPDEIVMEKIKEIQKRQWELNLQKNEFWQNELTDYFQNSEDPNEMMNYINLVNDLSVNDIKNAS